MPTNFLFSWLPVVRKEKEINRSFLANGSRLLEDLIASCDGKSNPIRCYSADELHRATNNFHPCCVVGDDTYGRMFRGFLDNRSIIIVNGRKHSLAIRNIIVSIQMSKHKNVLKLLGCCLEFPVPALVFEDATKGPLTDAGGLGVNEQLPWKTKLRIAKRVANALTYLHTAFPRPIIHRDVNPGNILLDDDYVPKLWNFSLSITIPPKQSCVEDAVKGTFAYLDPTYMATGFTSEKSDVYGFGVLLLVFLTGLKAWDSNPAAEENHLINLYGKLHACEIQTIVDPKILEEVGGDVQAQQQLRDFLALALLCTQEQSELRPYMIDVTKELVRIEKSILP